MKQKLSTKNHSRDIAGLKYVYPVISRRAGGLSIGINFNSNNACNWRCVYCQVPDLVRGLAPEMDFELLAQELTGFIKQVQQGDFYDRFNVPEEQRVIKDIAISGNGEPTSLKGFDKAIGLIGGIASTYGILPESEFVLISNGSLMHQPHVQAGLKILNKYHGKVWFKLDSATAIGQKKINDNHQSVDKALKNLLITTQLCTTSLQTCLLGYLSPDELERECDAYVALLKQHDISLEKIMLYTLARPSLQPEAKLLSSLKEQVMNKLADRLRHVGYRVSVSA